MLHILILILKILGIVLLSVLGILIALVLLVLLVPVRYQADVSFHGTPAGSAGVSWMLHLVRARISFDGSAKICVKALWFKVFEKTVWPPEEDRESDVPEEAVRTEESDDREQTVHATEVSEPVAVPDIAEEVRPAVKEEQRSGPESVPEDPCEGKTPDETAGPANEQKNKLEGMAEKLSGIRRRAASTWNSARNKYEEIHGFLSDEQNQNTFRLLFNQIKSLIKHILPRKLKGSVRFGLDDPYYTGQILTLISPFYGMYAKNVTVEPVFDGKALEGELYVKGHIRAATLLMIVLRVGLNKNFRKLLKAWKK